MRTSNNDLTFKGINVKIFTIIILTLISISSYADQNPPWEMEFGWRNNWTANTTYKINSFGKMKITQFSPYHEKICNSELDKQELSLIEEKIYRIPNGLPVGTIIQYVDKCSDENENYIYLTQASQVRGFIFSRENKCRATEVPNWLQALFSNLEQHIKLIENCNMSKRDIK